MALQGPLHAAGVGPANLLLGDDARGCDVCHGCRGREQQRHEEAAPGCDAPGRQQGGARVPPEGLTIHALADLSTLANICLHTAHEKLYCFR